MAHENPSTKTATLTDLAGHDAALLSAIEIGLGSVLHAWRIPFAGYFLSLNQGFLLSRSVLRARHFEGARTLPLTISSITALLKSLSPAGKKLTPMLAISAQGALFSAGTLAFGANAVGVAAGSAAASFWAFIQPVLIYWIFFGDTLIRMGTYYFQKVLEKLPISGAQVGVTLVALILLKAVIAVVLSLVAARIPEALTPYEKKLLQLAAQRQSTRAKVGDATSSPSVGGAAKLAIRDLSQPLFFVFLLMTLAFLLLAEANAATLIWAMLRPIAVGFVVFFVLRAFSFEPILQRLEKSGRGISLARSFRTAIATLRTFELR